ncbi:ImmA/IrrE family metallo-endopeptidase [Robertmurraya sp. DFI.2.37]|uniref:ImmA/IrrE family metallo-endopeptidase n=1 Tax=Robertmurraya sp. DFI.2.37 TaxID=3031819 RepID=UPI001245B862|nr:ImmA/IrrE family metallo-endopeptidase [Robertmurraya sp. DFI.2.37]MDF1510585.1 ImmA/IrrE family metallo-endopeptidase [Robertmurraya sp. DFI.2.37]
MVPEKVNVAGIEYSVKNVKGLSNNHDKMGVVRYGTAEIELDADMSQERKEQVFVHEMLHACFFEAGYTEQDEDAINRVSAILYQVLKDNAICFGKKVVYTDCGDKINICN